MADIFDRVGTQPTPTPAPAGGGDIFDRVDVTPEQSPWQKFTGTLGQGNVVTFFRHPLDTLGSMVTGTFHEPGRIIGELDAARNAKNSDDAWEHVKRAVPILGPQWNQIQHDIDNGGYAEATAHFIDMMAPFVGPEIAAKYGPPVIRNVAPAAKATGTFVKEAAPGLAKTAVTAVPAAVLHHYLPSPLGTAIGLPSSVAAGAQFLDTLREAGRAAGETFREAKAPEAAPAAPAPEPSEAYYAEQTGGRNAPAPTSEEYYASQQAAPPAEAGPSAADLDGISQDLAGKPFAKLDAQGQAVVRQIADKLNRAATPQPATPPSAPPPASPPSAAEGSIPPGTTIQDLLKQDLAAKRAAAAAAPAPAPEPQPAPPEAPTAPQTPAAATPQPASEAPAAAQVPTAAEVAQTKARATRAERTLAWADHWESKGKTPDDVNQMVDREHWRLEGLDPNLLPTSQAAVDKLRASIVEEMRSRSAAKPQPAPAEEPRPITKGGEALQPFTMARELAARGIDSTKAAKFPNARWQELGVAPNQVGPVMRALQAQERLGMTAVQ